MGPSDLDWFLKSCLEAGLREVYDMGSRDGLGLKLRGFFADTPLRVRTCGYALFKRGGYGGFIGRPIEHKDQIPEAVETLYQRGVDFIKVIHSGIVSLNAPGGVTEGGFQPDELQLLVNEAKRYGLRVHCHVNGEERIIEAIRAGVYSIEHGFFITERALKMMSDQGVAWTPTVYALEAFSSGLPSREASFYKELIKRHLQMIEYALYIGVRVNTGSDSGAKGLEHGRSYRKEEALLKQCTKY